MIRAQKPNPKRSPDDGCPTRQANSAAGRARGTTLPRSLLSVPSTATVVQPISLAAELPDFLTDLSATSRLLTVSEAAGLLAVSEKTIRRWIAAGRLPTVRFGRLVRISVKSLNEYMQLNGEKLHE